MYTHSGNIRIRSMACTIRLRSVHGREAASVLYHRMHSNIPVVYDACNVFKLSLIVSIPINGMRSFVDQTATIYIYIYIRYEPSTVVVYRVSTKIYQFAIPPVLIQVPNIQLYLFLDDSRDYKDNFN